MSKTIVKPTSANRAVPYLEAASILGVKRSALDRLTANTFSVIRHASSKRAPMFLMQDELEFYLRMNAKHGPEKAAGEVRALRKVKGRLRGR